MEGNFVGDDAEASSADHDAACEEAHDDGAEANAMEVNHAVDVMEVKDEGDVKSEVDGKHEVDENYGKDEKYGEDEVLEVDACDVHEVGHVEVHDQCRE